MKYIELVKGLFTVDHETRAKQSDPYVAYSIEGNRLMFTIAPEPVVLPPDNEIWYTSTDGNIVTPKGTDSFGANILSNTYENDNGVIKFDNSVTSIGFGAFEGCISITSIVIPNSVMNIGSFAFAGCCSLTSIIIPNSVTSIEQLTFYSCSSLTSVTIPESVVSISVAAFSGCSSLTSIIIPNSVVSIRDYAFQNCSSLTSITILAVVPPTLGSYNTLSNVTAVYVPAESVDAYKTAANWNYYANVIQSIL